MYHYTAFFFTIKKAVPDNELVYTRKAIVFPDSVQPGVCYAPCYEIGLRCIISWATHTHEKNTFKGLFLTFQRWNGQAWAVTLNHPWVRSLVASRAWDTPDVRQCLSSCCCSNVKANAHLASVVSAKESKLHSLFCLTCHLTSSEPWSILKPPAAFSGDFVCL